MTAPDHNNRAGHVLAVTMGGRGERFRSSGIEVPKPLIQVHGRTLFEWSVGSLVHMAPAAAELRLVMVAGDFTDDEMDNMLGVARRVAATVNVVALATRTGGQAETALKGTADLDDSAALTIFNIDTAIDPSVLRPQDLAGDGWIPTFDAAGDHWSFVSRDDLGRVDRVTEKQRISDHCSVGLYHFGALGHFRAAFEATEHQRESYVAPLYNHLISAGCDIRSSSLPATAVHVLGTPDELEHFRRLEAPAALHWNR